MSNPAFPTIPLHVWQQPQTNFATWQARGCNGLFNIPTGSTWTLAAQQAWVAAAEAAGLWQIRQPVGTLATDSPPHLLAWNSQDEPDANATPIATYQASYAAMRSAQPARTIVGNYSGGYVLQYQPTAPAPKWTQATYAPYLACNDWVASDFYPNAWQNPPTTQFLQSPAVCCTTLSTYSGGKRQFAFIETGNQGIGPAGTPTAGQVRYEAWHAVLCGGATGICYFPCQISPTFAFDNTAPDVAASLPQLNSEFTAVGPYLGSGMHGSALNSIFEYGEIKTGVNQLNVLLNATGLPQSYSGVQMAPWGVYAVLVTPTGNSVLCQTPMPPDVNAQIAALQASVATLQTQMASIAAAAK